MYGRGKLTAVARPDDLAARAAAPESQVTDLNERVRQTEHDATAARVPAGGADRDVAEIRGEIREFRDQNNRVLNALRADLTDLRQHTEAGFAEMRGKFDAAAAGQQQIVTLLDTLISQHGEQ